MELVEFKELRKVYGQTLAVDGISFNVGQGEVFGLLGPNGAGKSTTISVLATILKPTSGDVLVKGRSVSADPEFARKIIGLVPQEVALYPSLTARENLEFFGRMYGLRRNELHKRINEALEVSGLMDRADDRVETFSGGMQRRINLGVGLISRPELLILDEPTVGIDPQSRRHILDSVLALNHQGVTIIYTSHYMEEVEYLCNRVGIMDNGHLIALGGLNELKKAAGENETIEIQVGGLDNEDLASIAKINNVKQTRYEEDCLLVMTNDPASVIPTLSQLLYEQDCRVRSMRVQENNLETLFLNLTGKGLRD